LPPRATCRYIDFAALHAAAVYATPFDAAAAAVAAATCYAMLIQRRFMPLRRAIRCCQPYMLLLIFRHTPCYAVEARCHFLPRLLL